MLLEQISALVAQVVNQAFAARLKHVPLEFPQNRSFGDLTVNAFLLARELRRPPAAIAEELARRLSGLGPIEGAASVEGYVNLRLIPEAIFQGAIPEVLADPERFGRNEDMGGKRMMVEFSAPNTNKPQHLGHMRNNFLGDALSRLLANSGATVVRANLFNDRGIHICKSMLAYQRFGNGETPDTSGEKGDHFVGRYYMLFEREFKKERDAYIEAHPEHFQDWKAKHGQDRKGRPIAEPDLQKKYLDWFKEEGFDRVPLGRDCQQMLRSWEADEPTVRSLWETMTGWVVAGFEETYRRLGVQFDAIYRESETWRWGKEQVLSGLERGVFTRRPDGAVEIDLTAAKLDKKVVLRSDGTAVYITQDIGTTIRKAEEHQLDGQIWVVGNEQIYHFQVLFKILERLGYPWADHLLHLAYGMVNLPEGRMKTREGTVVDADDLLDEVSQLAADEVKARDPSGEVPPAEIQHRASVIALAALRFMLLKVAPRNDMLFDPSESVSFDGDTGARVLYAYARLKSMLQDPSADREPLPSDWTVLTDEAERNLALGILSFAGYASRAARESNPGAVATFLLELVRDLNRFYDRCLVLRESDGAIRSARIGLCRAAAAVLKRGADLLGMPLLDRM